jgi:translation initiation factor 1
MKHPFVFSSKSFDRFGLGPKPHRQFRRQIRVKMPRLSVTTIHESIKNRNRIFRPTKHMGGESMKKSPSDEPRLVYSSESGRICPDCGKPKAGCVCRKETTRPAGDGIVRIQRESKGRGGKTVTVITGIPLDWTSLKDLAGELKRRCGTGGTLKDGNIEIQGDHRDLLVAELEKRGYKVKRAGG